MGTKTKGSKDQFSIYEPGNDFRIDFLFEYVTRAFKIKVEKWLKFLTTEEYRKLLMDFLENPQTPLICFCLNQGGILSASNYYPTGIKTKSCFFIKKHPVVVVKEDPTFKDNLVYGDLSAQTLGNLVTLVEEVLKPMTEVDMLDSKWPDQVVADSTERSHEILNALHSLKGQLQGKTWLPIPLSLNEVAKDIRERNLDTVDKNCQKQAETLLLKWTAQISEVLHRSCSDFFDKGRHPTPATELQYWESRVDDLQCIYSQLHDEGAQAICGVLAAKTERRGPSRYFQCFRALIQNVKRFLDEAQSILTFFKPLRRHFDLLASASFDHEMYDLLRPMMHSLCYMWAYSPKYRESTRIIVLFKEISNLLIDIARTFLCGSLIFQVEPDQGFGKLKSVLDTLNYFKELFHAHKAALPAYFEPGEPVVHWDFLPSLIFTRFDKFIQRIQNLTNLFECTVEFYKLDKVEIGGCRGRTLGIQMLDIHAEFLEYFQTFSSISYDCCDPDDPTFDRDHYIFVEKSYQVDCRLSHVVSHAIEDCHTPESAHKLLMVLGPLLTRPLVKQDVAVKYLKYVELINKELDQVVELFEEQLHNIKDIEKRKMIGQSLPPFSATIHWIKHMKDRVNFSMTEFHTLGLNIAKEAEGLKLRHKYEKTIGYLTNYQEKTFKDWVKIVGDQCRQYLSENIICRLEPHKIMVNFNPGLTGTIKEVKYLKMAGFSEDRIPLCARSLAERREEFKKNTVYLHKIVGWYNHIYENMQNYEVYLMENQLEFINEMVTRGEKQLKWEDDSSTIWTFIQELKEPVHDLKMRLDESQQNMRVIKTLIDSWNDGPMFQRYNGKNYNMLDLQVSTCDPEINTVPLTIEVNANNDTDTANDTANDTDAETGLETDVKIIDEKIVQIQNPTIESARDKKYLKMIETSRKIHELCQCNKKLLTVGIDDSQDKISQDLSLKDGEKKWQNYLSVIDQQIHQGLVKTVATSLGYLLDHTDYNLTPSALMEVEMKLDNGKLFYTPALKELLDDSFLELIHWIISGIMQQAALVDRVTKEKVLENSAESENTDSSGDNYLKDIQNDPDLADMVESLVERANAVTTMAATYTERFDLYIYLWEEDRAEHLSQFLKYGHQLTQSELDLKAEGEEIPLTPATLAQFKESIDKYEALLLQLELIEDERIFDKWFRLNMRPFRHNLYETVEKWSFMFKQHLIDTVTNGLTELEKFVDETQAGLQQPLVEGDLKSLISVMDHLQKIKHRTKETDGMFEPIKEFIDLLKTYEYELPESVFVQLEELPDRWTALKKMSQNVRLTVGPLQQHEVSSIKKRIVDFDVEQQNYRQIFITMDCFNVNCPFPYTEMNECEKVIAKYETEFEDVRSAAKLFEVHVIEPKALKQCRKEIRYCKQLWDYHMVVETTIDDWKRTPWMSINAESMDLELKRMQKDIKALDKDVRMWDIFISLESNIRNMVSSLKSVGELQNPSISDRHWEELLTATKILPRLIIPMIEKLVRDERTTLADLYGLSLHNYEEEVKNVVDKAVKESSMEKTLKELGTTWAVQEYGFEVHKETGIKLLKTSEELIETLEDNQVQLQNIAMSKYIAFFREEVEFWQQRLAQADNVLTTISEVQRTWGHLQSIFVGSEDIRINLPEDSARFDRIDRDIRATLEKMYVTTNVIEGTNQADIYSELLRLQSELTLCEKALANYQETKRLKFPRFYFVSSADLLDILSNGNEPKKVIRHLNKIFDSLTSLVFETEKSDTGEVTDTTTAHSMKAKDGEIVLCQTEVKCVGPVEDWLNVLEHEMRVTIRNYLDLCVHAYGEKSREKWIFEYMAQVALCGTQIWWTTELNQAFSKLEDGNENSLKEYFRKQVNQLNTLISLLVGELTNQERQKIMTICTIDVHSRDVVGKMIQSRIETAQAFQWQSQLRHRWDEEAGDCFCNICDAQLRYLHEYLGNTPRLVITPLTDRCYITLTQSLHLVMGGAPAGPAGTGKTETTKDLGRALGLMVYVFNCSEQMDYKSIGSIFKGLVTSGSWGCFDEFNRISVEVLSVVAVQVKSIQDAIRDKKLRFNFMGDEISLKATVGVFITMNPGYAGRSELPENLKVLFRPCAMCVPDFELICEIMLVAEGFLDARVLARKFITLYTLCKELLSKQDHYDWGLRAIKSVLVVAGSLKRGDPGRPEDEVLMRALRDFNIPKIIMDDTPVFMGLIGDLFPALDVPRKRDVKFENIVKDATALLKLQPEENFVLKIVQLQELLDVRHSVFVLGGSGTGKSQVWKTLFQTYKNTGRKAIYNDLNPKAVTNDELFGIITGANRDWKDGIFSVVMRDQANMEFEGPKWIVLDGDIDPMWIESLNTVMDDNKVLTLASNERIALTKDMRLLFEIYTLKHATPATVSRAGILYLNPQDLGWNAFVTTWVGCRQESAEIKIMLTQLFEKYIPSVLESMKSRFKKIIPIPEITHIELLCNLLDVLFDPENLGLTENMNVNSIRNVYETYFAFACVWAFGSALVHDQATDHRLEFSKWWQSEWKTIVLPPSTHTVFDYFIDPETRRLTPWTEIVPKFELDPDVPLQSTLVHTAETIRVKYFMDILIEKGCPLMLVGGGGSGKTVLVNDKLSQLPENYAVANVPFNFYTTSEMLQKILEKPLEKKAGRNYGPAGNKQLVYFIDDLNMPMVDEYETVQPHTMIRQHMDYGHWYDRIKLQLKDIHNVQYIAAMNPTAGSFTINPRLQRHFAVFSIGFPGADALQSIYKTILQQHLALNLPGITPIHKMAGSIVQTALSLHAKVVQAFLPTAAKFHYVFNLRDLSNIFQGLLFSSQDCLRSQYDLVRLWMHESSRVYQDKMTDDKDIGAFQKFLYECFKKGFEDLDETVVLAPPLIYYHFALGAGEAKYMPVTDFPTLQASLADSLKSYNDFNSIMNLVLFDAAINYVCRISRILESPRGNVLLVGVGGSGKQSLARLAAYLSGIDVFQITLRKGYSCADLKSDLAVLYLKAGKSLGSMFLMTDAQIVEERFLVLVNDMLASGEIPDLLPDDEIENVIAQMRSEVKGVGLQDTRENCWKFFIDRVKKMLKTVLCMSPVGNTLRNRSRKFPAVTNATQIIWFQEWPEEALMSVSQRFVKDIEVLPVALHDPIASFMAFVHMSVSDMSKIYLSNDKRYNYTTPKSFLEQIDLYEKLLTKNTTEALTKASRLEAGLAKLEICAEEVEKLKKTLAVQEVILKEKNDKADELIKIVGEETTIVTTEKENAAREEKNVAVVAEEVAKIQAVCQVELEKAEPALQAAYAALNTLNKTNLTELKTFTTPPVDVVMVVGAVFILWEGTRTGRLPKDKSWKATKSQMMGDIGKFLEGLQNLNKENITPMTVDALKPYMMDPGFHPDLIRAKSFAASGLCSYVINVLKFNEVWQDVAPKRKALTEATNELNANLDKLAFLKGRVKELEEKLEVLTKEFEAATEAKMICQEEADKTTATIDLANRLVGGLASEKIRWIQNVKMYRDSTLTIPGDMLLVTAFVSYMGSFTKNYRIELLERIWVPYLEKMNPPIPMSGNIDPLTVLTDDAEIAKWNSFGLPNDRMSSENATILVNSQRWPLMIDPQLQGLKWIKNMYGAKLKVIRLGQKGYLDVIEEAIIKGGVVLLENIHESVDPVLEPLLARNLIKKGTAIKMGDKEVDYNAEFRLILQTKLANPHYQPEMQAQTTLINFTVTRDGLEDQLLAEVVKVERPDLESQKSALTQQQNEFKILLIKLEGDLLNRLQLADSSNLLSKSLVMNLETTKKTASEVEVKAKEAVITSANIDAARELYRPASSRASLLYFILNDLNKIHPLYQFSLKAFSTVFQNAIKSSKPASDISRRVENLIDSITYSVWLYTTRGLFESDKLIFTATLAFQIQMTKDTIQPRDFDFLLRFPIIPNVASPVDFLSNPSWGAVKSLSLLDDFRDFDREIESYPKKWKQIIDSECPEREKLPGEWKSREGVQKLCIMRCLRPDRMTYSVSVYIEENLGGKYVKARRVDFSQSYEESSRETPVFFILSPGVDPLKDVETLGKKIGYTFDLGNFHNVSLGQGQEVVAEEALERAGRDGHWVILQNIHLVARWLPTLEKKLEQNWDNSSDKYRVFLSAEPASTHEGHIIPQGILESSIKITNEAPTGMLANVHKALDNFSQETLETCSKELEFKAILFTLCYFHAVVAERRKFGSQGWNKGYPFSTGDLTISVNVLYNYLEANNKIPWDDLRYLFGEIMYGGHITDDWDRRLCRTYLEEFMVQECLDGEIEYAPGFPAPPSTDFIGYHSYIDELLPPESPNLYGLHPNAEIGFLTTTSDTLFKTILELQPKDAGGGGGMAATKDEKMKNILDDILDKLPEAFNMNEIQQRAEEKTPYVIVALQECDRMNMLTILMRKTLKELDSGLKGELGITSDMEELGNALFMDQVPNAWAKKAYPSTFGLASWYADLLLRCRELEIWTNDFLLPPSVWLGGFFNPQSFLTAIMQSTARRQELPLDKMCLQCDVTKKTKEETTAAPKDGACIHGLFMEGARWDILAGCITESRPKELYPSMPVVFLKAITQDKQDNRNSYDCPVYKTRQRGPNYIWTFNLRIKDKPAIWVLCGVAILLQV